MPQQYRRDTYSSPNSNERKKYGTRTEGIPRAQTNSSEKYSATFKFSHVSVKSDRQKESKTAGERSEVYSGTAASSRRPVGEAKRYGVSKSSHPKNDLPSRSVKKEKDNAAVSVPVSLRKRLTAQRMPKMQTVEARIVRRFPFKLVFLAVFGTVLFLLMIYNNVQINEKSSDVEKLKQKIVEMDDTIRKTSLDVERKNDLRIIEKRALELGMVKSDQLDKRYITIPSDDKVTLINDDEESKTFHMTGLFETIKDSLLDFINLFK